MQIEKTFWAMVESLYDWASARGRVESRLIRVILVVLAIISGYLIMAALGVGF